MTTEDLIAAARRDIADADHCVALHITPAVHQLHRRLREVTDALAALSSPPTDDVRAWRPEDGDTRCQSCGRPNPVWWADNADWNRLMPNDGVLCPTCYHALWMGGQIVAPHLPPPTDDVREALRKLIMGPILDSCYAAGHATTWARGGYRNDVPTLCDPCQALIRSLPAAILAMFEVRPRGPVTDAKVPALPDDCDCEDREALVRPEGLVCGTCGKVIAPEAHS